MIRWSQKWEDSISIPIFANLMTRLGLWLSFVATLILIQSQIKLTFALALIIITKRLPSAFISYFLGPLTDQLDQRKSIVVSLLLLIFLVLSLSLVDFTGYDYYFILLGAYVLLSSIEGFYKPCYQALVATLYEHDDRKLKKANTLSNTTGMLAVLLAGVMSATLYSICTLNTIFVISGALFAIAGFSFHVLLKFNGNKNSTSKIYLNVFKIQNLKFKKLYFTASITLITALVYSYISLVVTKFPFEVYGNGKYGAALIQVAIAIGICFSAFFTLYNVREMNSTLINFIVGLEKNYFRKIFFLGIFLFLFSISSYFFIGLIFLVVLMALYGNLKLYIENDLILTMGKGNAGKTFSVLYVFEEMIISMFLLVYSFILLEVKMESLGIIIAVLLTFSVISLIEFKKKSLFKYSSMLFLVGTFFISFLIVSQKAKADVPDLQRVQEIIAASESKILEEKIDQKYWSDQAFQGIHVISQYYLFLKWAERDLGNFNTDYFKEILLQAQETDGSWKVFQGFSQSNQNAISASVLHYMALKSLGVSVESSSMKLAQNFILKSGGISKADMITKITLALFGQLSWDFLPNIPKSFLSNGDLLLITHKDFAPWIYDAIAPIIYLKNRNLSKNLGELYSLEELKLPGEKDFRPETSKENYFHKGIQRIIENQSQSGLWSMSAVASTFSLVSLLDYSKNIPDISMDQKNKLNTVLSLGLRRLEQLHTTGSGAYKGVSHDGHVWDTLLTLLSLQEGQDYLNDSNLKSGILESLRYLSSLQDKDGGFYFGKDLVEFPDLDDTALAIIAFSKHKDLFSLQIENANKWILSMQNKDGGWASFSKNRTGNKVVSLLSKKFALDSEMFDKSCADVTAHVLEALELKKGSPVKNALKFLERKQDKNGSWEGCWGVNRIYGTSSVIGALKKIGKDLNYPPLKKAVEWLKSVQNKDGGFGETVDSYLKPENHGQGESTASQTAWSLLALLEVENIHSNSIQNAVNFLMNQYKAEGVFKDNTVVGTGIGGSVYIHYPQYSKIFPLMALKKYKKFYFNEYFF